MHCQNRKAWEGCKVFVVLVHILPLSPVAPNAQGIQYHLPEAVLPLRRWVLCSLEPVYVLQAFLIAFCSTRHFGLLHRRPAKSAKGTGVRASWTHTSALRMQAGRLVTMQEPLWNDTSPRPDIRGEKPVCVIMAGRQYAQMWSLLCTTFDTSVNVSSSDGQFSCKLRFRPTQLHYLLYDVLLVMKRVLITDRLLSQAMIANTVAPGHMPWLSNFLFCSALCFCFFSAMASTCIVLVAACVCNISATVCLIKHCRLHEEVPGSTQWPRSRASMHACCRPDQCLLSVSISSSSIL